jgi:hypothetical protein
MINVYALLMFTLGLVYFGFIGYLAWFSPRGYAKLLIIWKKWTKATSLLYSERYVNFFLSPRGIGLWIIRIIIIPAVLLCIRGMVFGISGK